jgi:hypothetical protein
MWLAPNLPDGPVLWEGRLAPETDQDAERFVRDQAERGETWSAERFHASVRDTLRELPTVSVARARLTHVEPNTMHL